MSDIIKFDFYGDELDCVKDDNTLWVSVRRICEALQIDFSGQLIKLKAKSWATIETISTVDASGRKRPQSFVDMDTVPLCLANIEEGRVADSVKPKLIRYQKEATTALRDYFFTGQAIKAPSMPTTIIEAGERWLAALKDAASEKEGRLLAEAKIEADEPMVNFANDIGAATKDIQIGDFAKIMNNNGLKVGRNRLYYWLRSQKYLLRDNKPYQRYVDTGWFVLIEKTRESDNGPIPWCQTRITGRGQVNLARKMRDSGYFGK